MTARGEQVESVAPSSVGGERTPGGYADVAPARNVATAIREVLSTRVFDLADLPGKATLVIRSVVLGEHVVFFTTSRERACGLLAAGEIVCTPTEYEALAIALADGRCSREDAHRELSAKLGPLGHRIELARLLRARDGGPGIARPEPIGRRWTFADLLCALGAELVDVEV